MRSASSFSSLLSSLYQASATPPPTIAKMAKSGINGNILKLLKKVGLRDNGSSVIPLYTQESHAFKPAGRFSRDVLEKRLASRQPNGAAHAGNGKRRFRNRHQ